MPSQRSGMAVAVYRERIFAIGGERRGGTFTNNEAFDPRTNTWSAYGSPAAHSRRKAPPTRGARLP